MFRPSFKDSLSLTFDGSAATMGKRGEVRLFSQRGLKGLIVNR